MIGLYWKCMQIISLFPLDLQLLHIIMHIFWSNIRQQNIDKKRKNSFLFFFFLCLMVSSTIENFLVKISLSLCLVVWSTDMHCWMIICIHQSVSIHQSVCRCAHMRTHEDGCIYLHLFYIFTRQI